ncbi:MULTISPECIES: hypothetical protein [unclassified Streptomyces]|uniref:hypothetical protein n=1 Tax=unclassified Streptomyces TaxID=2593676 RepID=UPI003399000D
MSTDDRDQTTGTSWTTWTPEKLTRAVQQHPQKRAGLQAQKRAARRAQHFEKLQEVVTAILAEYDEAAGMGIETRAPSMATVATLATNYRYAITDDDRTALAIDVAEGITLAEAGTIRRAAEAVRLATPDIITREAAAGTDTATIAAELGMTTSYVRRIVREHNIRATEAEITKRLADDIASLADRQAADTPTTD